jgi:predicted phosphodiesterase
VKILKEFGLTEAQLRRMLTKADRQPRIINQHITKKTLTFGIISDTHFGSNEEKLDELRTFYHICKKEGVEAVFHAGDILQGQKMYPGWEMEIKVFGADAQVAHCVKNYPRLEGVTTYFITGTHDTCYYKQNGTEVGEKIAAERSDLVYLGQYSGRVNVSGLDVMLVHPSGGVPYSLSYRGQKIAEQIPSGQKPHFLVIGHLHVAYYFPYRNMHVIGAGCFQGQTSYLLQKGLNPNVGGWIVKVRLAEYKKTSVVAAECGWIPFIGR